MNNIKKKSLHFLLSLVYNTYQYTWNCTYMWSFCICTLINYGIWIIFMFIDMRRINTTLTFPDIWFANSAKAGVLGSKICLFVIGRSILISKGYSSSTEKQQEFKYLWLNSV